MNELKRDVVKSNALIEAIYNPGSVYNMRLLMAALMQVKAGEPLDYKHRYYISANALADLTGSKAKNNYEELKKAANDLMEKIVYVRETPDGKPLKFLRKINLVSSCDYIDDQGTVGLRFTDEITPYISDLRKRFTQYQAKYVMPMRSSYGIRLYELCLQWLGDEREFSVDEFRRMFGLENKYKSIKDLKVRVINPALNDINTHSDIRVIFGQRKAGRVVSHFQFMIVKKQKKKEKLLSHKDWISANNKANVGEDWDSAIKRTKTEYKQYREQD